MKTAFNTVRILAALLVPFGMAMATLVLAGFLATASGQAVPRHGPGVVTILNDLPETAVTPKAPCNPADSQNCS